MALCPTCGSQLSHVLRYEGEPVPEWVPEGIIAMHGVAALHIAEIMVKCEEVHEFTAESYMATLVPFSERYEGPQAPTTSVLV